jgi:hypothetical protein
MCEAVKNRSSAHCNGFFEGILDAKEVVEKMERDAVKANKYVVSQDA